MEKTITLQIGNSDDKLTQRKWSLFCEDITELISGYTKTIHFSAPSIGCMPWQNYCIVFNMDTRYYVETLKALISRMAKEYEQDSIAWTEGTTEFIEAYKELDEILENMDSMN